MTPSNPLPAHRPPQAGLPGQAGRRAPDLALSEAAVARWFEALPRAAAPGAAWPEALVPARAPGRLAAVARPLAVAAAVLLALALPARGHDLLAYDAGCAERSARGHLTVAVVDDPSVPMLHGLETFDQLACLTQPDGVGAR